MNALDRVAPLVAGVLIVALLVSGLVYAAVRVAAAARGLTPP